MIWDITIDRPLKRQLGWFEHSPDVPLRGIYLVASEGVNSALSLELGLHASIGFVLIARLWQQGRHIRYEIEADYLINDSIPGHHPNFTAGKLAWLEGEMAYVCGRQEETYQRVLDYLGLKEEDL